MFERVRRPDLQSPSALRVEYSRYNLDSSGAVIQALSNHAGLGAVREETTEEQLDVRIVISRVRVFCVYESSHLRYA